jgi:PAS domain S-box-containing protein
MISGQILIADDNEAVRRSLRSLLSSRPGWTICGEAVDGLDAVSKAIDLRPDVVLMDLSMPRMNGLEATRILRKELPQAKIVIVSQNDPAVVAPQVRDVGAATYIAKTDLSRSLFSTLDRLFGPTQPTPPVTAADVPQEIASEPGWLAGGGILGGLIRTHDWSQTPLGPLTTWPQSLKTAVNLILSSQHPMWIGWGPDITFLYNDAYVQVLSLAKHPQALGRPAAEVWAEIWDICGPLADKVFQRGEASFVDDVRLFMSRGDFLEETYYSFSYSPIRDEAGKVAGLFCPSTEVTAKVINARRLGTLSELSSVAFTQKTTEAACSAAAATLAKNPDDVPFSVLYLIEKAGDKARIQQTCGLPPDVVSLLPSLIDLKESDPQPVPWPVAQVANTGQSQIVDIRDLKSLPRGPANQALATALILPVTSRGEDRPLGVLIAGVNPTRRLDAEYRTFYDLISSQIATAIQNVRAAEEERQRLEALAEIDRAKTAFFSNVSHEFRTPLTLMLGPVEDLLEKSHTGLSPAAKNQLELVNRNGTRLLRLVNTLLDFSRIEAGRMQAMYQPTDLAAFTAELAGVFRSATERAGLRLELDCPTLAAPVFVDRNMWEKIVLNLISNAFKFTFEGEIRVELVPLASSVELRVRDTGVGIPAQELPRLFDRFHRIENTRSRTHEGSGIGLALVQELVKLHGGTVRAESEVGKGTTFIVSLPLGSSHLPADRIGKTRTLASTAVGAAPFVEEALRWLPEAEHLEVPDEILPSDQRIPVPCPPSSDADEESEKPRILVADDNADMRQYLVRLLAERYRVEVVPDGEAALASARKRSPDVVLSDVMMPNLDGFGLLRALREDTEMRTIPIILLSARAGEESRIEGMEHGADDYLIKPFSARELLARVQTHLEMARIRKQAEAALRESEERATNIVESIADGFMVLDREWRITYINPRAVEMFQPLQKTRESVLGKILWDEFPDTLGTIFEKNYRRTLLEQTTVAFEAFYPPLQSWFDVRSYPTRDGISIYLLDITERKLAEENYRNLAESLDAEVRARTRELEVRNTDVVRQSKQLRDLSVRLLQVQDEERRRIARELHDSAGQILAALAMNLSRVTQHAREDGFQLLEEAEDSQQLVQQLTQEIRTMSYLLHPPLLDETGLSEAVRWYIQGLTERNGLEIQLDVSDDFGRLPREMELVMFRLVQECLTNIHRHSGSKSATIRIARDGELISLDVQDKGKGISPERLAEIQAKGSGVGITGMRERVRQFGGRMKLESSADGTRISFVLPLMNRDPSDRASNTQPVSVS